MRKIAPDNALLVRKNTSAIWEALFIDDGNLSTRINDGNVGSKFVWRKNRQLRAHLATIPLEFLHIDCQLVAYLSSLRSNLDL